MKHSSVSSRGKLSGKVLRGEGEGHRIGYPTANLTPRLRRFARDGIYACHVWLARKQYSGVTVVGVPGKRGKKFEVHIIGLRRNIYGKALSLKLIKRLRGLRVFRTNAALRAQIRKDVAQTRKVLKRR